MEVKIPKLWVDVAMQQRVLVNQYKTNHFMKMVGAFCVLKTLTTTGIFHNYNEQPLLRESCKLSRNSFKKTISDLNKIGMVQIIGNDLKLVSWNQATQIVCQEQHNNEFFSFDFKAEDNAKIQYYFFALNIYENQHKQQNSFKKRLESNPTLKTKLIELVANYFQLTIHQVEQMPLVDFMECLYQLQNNQFCVGTLGNALFELNCDVNRSISKLKHEWSFNSTKSVSYYKKRMAMVGMSYTEKIGTLISQTKNRIRTISGQYNNGFDKMLKLPTWNRVDRLHLQFLIA